MVWGKRRFPLVLVFVLAACGKSAPPAPAPVNDAAASPPAAPSPPAAAPDTAVPPATAPDAAVPPATAPDAAVPPAVAPDAAVPPAVAPDAAVPPADAAPVAADGAPASAKIVLDIDAGPVAGAPVDLGKLEGSPGAESLCAAVRAQTAMECEDERKAECGCTLGRIGQAGAREAALLATTATVIPGVTAAFVLVQKDGVAWQPMTRLGQSESGMRGDNGSTTTLHHVGAAELGAAGRWVWVDVMREDFQIEVGTVWTRTLWLCGGVERATCHGVPLKSWWSPKIKGLEDLQKEVGLPPPPAELQKFALAVTLDGQGTLTIAGKTEVPGALAALVGKHALTSLGQVKGVLSADLPTEDDDAEP